MDHTFTEMYCGDYTRGTTSRTSQPTIEKETVATGQIEFKFKFTNFYLVLTFQS